MCSFLITSWLISNLTAVNFFLKGRGPDHTEVRQKGPFTFVHNLLHMTGERVIQPFIEDDVVVIYNGEIYNSNQVPPGYPERHRYRSDGECLLPSYRQLGPRFPRALDGEWALVVVDLAAGVAVLSTDVFSTKPLWYSLHDGFHAASYQSALLELGLPEDSVVMANPNEVLELRLDGAAASVVARYSVHEFDTRQFKTSTEDWQNAFRRAVRKRVAGSNHPIFVGLSSGYDSGAIHVALEEVAPEHSVHYFSVGAEELSDVLQVRIDRHAESISRAWKLQLSLSDYMAEKDWLSRAAEPFRYGKSNWAGGSVQEDGAAVGLSVIFRRCRHAGILVYMSGAGADEIISDYGFAGEKFFPHSSFGGRFPANLSEHFPWQSVFLGTQRDYLMKEEVVAGSHGVEARYPFLDREAVQEFLWLSAEAKNEIYKRPVHDLLAAANYPFDAGRKEGFAASRNLKLSGPTAVDVVFDAMGTKVSPRHSSELSCVAGPGARSGPWQQVRSRLVAFLATPPEEYLAVEELAGHLLQEISEELQGAPDCPLGELCARFFLLLLMDPSAREKQLSKDPALWEAAAAAPWEEAASSGWPLFSLLERLSREVSDGQPAPEHWRGLGDLVPLAGCGGAFVERAELDVPVAMLASSSDLSHVAACQRALTDAWAQHSALDVFRSVHMCEAFSALERLSEPHYRVNLADGWMLAK